MEDIREMLKKVAAGELSVDNAVLELKKEPFTAAGYDDLGFAKLDTHRKLRQGAAEVIYGGGKTAEQIVEILEKEKEKICIYLIVDTLLYLQKGGRLSTTGMVVGSALNLKPILSVRYGEVRVAGLARGQKSAWDKVLKTIEKDGGMDKTRGYNLGFTGKKECVSGFEAFIKEHFDAEYKKTVPVGSVIGVHVGPGANAVAVFLN